MSTSVVEWEVPVEESEAYRELMGRTFKRTGKVPAEILVRQEQGMFAAIECEKGKKCPLALASGRRAA